MEQHDDRFDTDRLELGDQGVGRVDLVLERVSGDTGGCDELVGAFQRHADERDVRTVHGSDLVLGEGRIETPGSHAMTPSSVTFAASQLKSAPAYGSPGK